MKSKTGNSKTTTTTTNISKEYVDRYIDPNELNNATIVRNNKNNNMNNKELTNLKRITINNSPTNDKDAANKKYIDDKIIDLIKRNTTNNNDNGYISFYDSDNQEYRLTKYLTPIQLTDITYFNHITATSPWNYYSSVNNINNALITRSLPTPIQWSTGPFTLFENRPFLVIHAGNMGLDTTVELFRKDIHNVTRFEMIMNNFEWNNSVGEITILIKDVNDVWKEVLKLEENTNVSLRHEWDTHTVDINERNYGIKMVINRKQAAVHFVSIVKISLTYTI